MTISIPLPICCTSPTETQLETQIHALAEKRVQGTLIKSRLLFLHLKHGIPTLKKVLQNLPESDRALLVKTVYVGEWYSLATLIRLDMAIQKEIGAMHPTLFEELGAFSADLNLGGTYEPLMRKDVKGLLQLTAVMSKTYQTFGEADYIPEATDSSGKQAATLRINYDEPPPSHYCQSGLGYFRQAVQLCGGKHVTARITACRQQGDPACSFRIEWDVSAEISVRPEA
ncbi:MAG: DUF2378 family protein [Blastocatellia bacterium]|nr:DUF2378 family protein [Blastocatellia bacterium]